MLKVITIRSSSVKLGCTLCFSHPGNISTSLVVTSTWEYKVVSGIIGNVLL